MSPATLDPALRREIKETVAEALREERETLHGFLLEALEDTALGEAIRRGRESDELSRNQMFALLKKAGGDQLPGKLSSCRTGRSSKG